MRSRHAKPVRPLILFVLVATLTGCGENFVGPFPGAAERAFIRRLPGNGVSMLRVAWTDGDVSISVDPAATEIRATGKYRTFASPQLRAVEALDKIAARLTVDPATPGTFVLALAIDRDADNADVDFGADLNIVLPASVPLDIQSRNGNVTISGVRGALQVIVENGDADVRMPTDTAATLTLTGSSVSTALDGFAVSDRVDEPGRIAASLNGGGAAVTIEALNGDASFGGL